MGYFLNGPPSNTEQLVCLECYEEARDNGKLYSYMRNIGVKVGVCKCADCGRSFDADKSTDL